jgi:hypothetical protein
MEYLHVIPKGRQAEITNHAVTFSLCILLNPTSITGQFNGFNFF